MKSIFIRFKSAVILLLVGVVLVSTIAIAKPSFLTVMAQKRELPIYCVNREFKIASLTFDAAWGNGY